MIFKLINAKIMCNRVATEPFSCEETWRLGTVDQIRSTAGFEVVTEGSKRVDLKGILDLLTIPALNYVFRATAMGPGFACQVCLLLQSNL